MRLAVVSHKICWKNADASGFVTDGGFPLQMEAISELFAETRLCVPCRATAAPDGAAPLAGRRLAVVPLSVPRGAGLRRKLDMVPWIVRNSLAIWREVRRADAVHAPIPGDVGTIGMVFAMLQRKPLFVRHCGNWMVQKTTAERFWRWSMERFAGGRNVMLATGGAPEAPSRANEHVKWIFSTSLRERDLRQVVAKKHPAGGRLRLVIACRQEKYKGTDVVIESLPRIVEKFPHATLDVIGDGALVPQLKERAAALKLAGRVTFHGKVKQSRVVALMREADLFCYPTSASEGFPKVVLEALAAGLPVITTRVSVLPELIGGDCGLLLDAARPEELAAAVARLAGDAALYEKCSAQAVARAREFSLENWRDAIGRTLREQWRVSALS